MKTTLSTIPLLATLMVGIASPVQAENLDLSLGLVNVRPDIESPVVGADATNEVKPILNLTYYVGENLALNTAAGITRHTFTADGNKLGKASMAPFHLMLQYHFMRHTDFSPYIGAGLHHTVFFDKGGPAFDGLKAFPADTGGVLQVGFDYAINKDYFINFDVKKFYLETDVVPKGGSKVETIKLDPLLVGLAIGRHF